VPSIPTVSIVPSSLAHARQLGEPGGRGRDLELAEAAAELVEGDRQVGVLVGVDTEGDQHLGVWHRCHRTVSSSLMVMTVRRPCGQHCDETRRQASIKSRRPGSRHTSTAPAHRPTDRLQDTRSVIM
jgi:hypothetical protein